MNLEGLWAKRPKDGKSVSLTLLVLSTVLLVLAGSLEASGLVESTSVFPELFYSSLALYFGRRTRISTKDGVDSEGKNEKGM